jgi:hypothetical protein
MKLRSGSIISQPECILLISEIKNLLFKCKNVEEIVAILDTYSQFQKYKKRSTYYYIPYDIWVQLTDVHSRDIIIIDDQLESVGYIFHYNCQSCPYNCVGVRII